MGCIGRLIFHHCINLDWSWSGHLDGVDVEYVAPLEVNIWIDLKSKFEVMRGVSFERIFWLCSDQIRDQIFITSAINFWIRFRIRFWWKLWSGFWSDLGSKISWSWDRFLDQVGLEIFSLLASPFRSNFGVKIWSPWDQIFASTSSWLRVGMKLKLRRPPS